MPEEPVTPWPDDVDELTQAQERAQRAESALHRERAARTAKLPLELADRLHGDTEDELLADAKRVAAIVKATNDAMPKPNLQTRSKPVVGAGPGNGGSEPGNGKDPASLAAAIRKAMPF